MTRQQRSDANALFLEQACRHLTPTRLYNEPLIYDTLIVWS